MPGKISSGTERNETRTLISIFSIFTFLEFEFILRMATKKGSDQPKGAKTGYIFFSMAARPKISQANPEMKLTEVSKILGEQWKCLDEKQKAKYSKMAEEDKIRYKEECEAFIQSGGEIKKRATKGRASMAKAQCSNKGNEIK